MNCIPILSITGSDGVGGTGIQADIKTISSLGGYAATAITAVTVQNSTGIKDVFDLPANTINRQVEAVMDDMHPEVLKIGMLRNRETASAIARILDLYKPKHVVYDPGIVSAHGNLLIDKGLVGDFQHRLFPLCSIVCLKCEAATLLLNSPINTTDDAVRAARQLIAEGSNAILLMGGKFGNNSLTDVLLEKGDAEPQYFSTPGIIDRSSHGVGGVLSSALATYLAQGCEIKEAVTKAREYVNRLILYSVDPQDGSSNNLLHHPNASNLTTHAWELYNTLMKEIVAHFKTDSDVGYYAAKLNVTPRYLAQITRKVAGKTPKELIKDQQMNEIRQELANSGKSIQSIAYEFGFSTQAQFAKFFKQMNGNSPTEFRNSQKQ